MTDQASEVLTSAASVSCTFKGTVTTGNPKPVKLIVAGNPVLVASGVSHWTVNNCQATSGNSKAPCSAVGPPTAGTSAKLLSNGPARPAGHLQRPVGGFRGDSRPHGVSEAATPSPLKAV